MLDASNRDSFRRRDHVIFPAFEIHAFIVCDFGNFTPMLAVEAALPQASFHNFAPQPQGFFLGFFAHYASKVAAIGQLHTGLNCSSYSNTST